MRAPAIVRVNEPSSVCVGPVLDLLLVSLDPDLELSVVYDVEAVAFVALFDYPVAFLDPDLWRQGRF